MGTRVWEQENVTPDGGLPRVSIITPAYNAAQFIAETLNSVFAQHYRDFEVIVVNDGSPDTDELERVLRPYLGRIQYLSQQNAGPAAARNAGIRRAVGRYVAFLDSDDTWDPEYLQAQLRLIESQEGVDLVYADLRLVGDSLRSGGTFMHFCPSRGTPTFESLLSGDCCVPTSATMVRKRVLAEAGLFNESPAVRGVEDFDMWLRVAWRGARIAYQRRALGTYRVHKGSVSANQAAQSAAAVQVLAKLNAELGLSKAQRALLLHQQAFLEAEEHLFLGKRDLVEGDLRNARERLAKANVFFRRFRISIAIAALRFAPGLAARCVALWQRLLQALSRVRARRWRRSAAQRSNP
jgi:GT2 family glycosyltransferase